MGKRVYDYAELKEKYEELKNEKADVVEVKEQNEILRARIQRLEDKNRYLEKERIELSYLITELMKGKGLWK